MKHPQNKGQEGERNFSVVYHFEDAKGSQGFGSQDFGNYDGKFISQKDVLGYLEYQLTKKGYENPKIVIINIIEISPEDYFDYLK